MFYLETFTAAMMAVYRGFRSVEFVIYGFSFSVWDLFIFSIFGLVVFSFLGRTVFASEE